MVLKRTYHVTPKDIPVAKRLKRIEQQVYRNRSEMKTRTVTNAGTLTIAGPGNIILFTPCRMANGADSNERVGDKIRLWRIEVRGNIASTIDSYVLQQKTATQPTAASFTTHQGAYLLDQLNTNQFTEWVHYANLSAPYGTQIGKFSKSFKGGLLVKYNGTAGSNCIDNEIVVAMLNKSTADNLPFSVSCRIWYTDA